MDDSIIQKFIKLEEEEAKRLKELEKEKNKKNKYINNQHHPPTGAYSPRNSEKDANSEDGNEKKDENFIQDLDEQENQELNDTSLDFEDQFEIIAANHMPKNKP